ncbi:ClpXP protease specificity-enhancing factor [Pseudothauera nasutitermitis]|uniref:ClpXP protease specificity-enhancing factor n=1 Tax=Pseudothauera nasutitermitis TaxID=2565930 RepID=A0A4S4B0D8_9RHOO|nr:ClpXP protease specificity-enhancing factor [Pseudothauera nasutitermitis]THF65921.1 ClpXP protease specificity-enhancing factor [Pseudothauera nasutitermitis]
MSTASTKPYLIRAIYEWCVDQGFTPYLAAVVDGDTLVPPGAARDGQIVLNIDPQATHQLSLGNERITFQARFGGVAQSVGIPVDNVLAVYARENGQGMAFEIERAEIAGEPAGEEEVPEMGAPLTTDGGVAGPEDDGPGTSGGGRPAARGGHLKVVK